MQSNESPVSLSPQVDKVRKTSPFHPRNLFNLFFRPRRFFERLHLLAHEPYVYLCAWAYGIGTLMSRTVSLRPSGGIAVDNSEQGFLWQLMAGSWLQYWLLHLILGA